MPNHPDRIRPLLKKLANAWEQTPELRLGQLLATLAQFEGSDGDLYDVPDAFIERAVDAWIVRFGR